MKDSMNELHKLKSGTALQQEVYELVCRHRFMEMLHAYHPLLVGTVPLDIQVPGSDLDLICEVRDFATFRREAHTHFGHYPGYAVQEREVDGVPRIKVNFHCEHWPIELFGQPVPTPQQNGYRHMMIEARLLSLYGEDFKQRIIHLKQNGLKTEPAFAKVLHLEGDPYIELLKLEGKTDAELLKQLF